MYNFDDIIGNENIVKSLRAAISRGHIGHAYIVSGASGSGKKLLALAFAKAVLCESKGTAACNFCTSCKTLEAGSHPDVVYVRPTKKSMGIDDIREQVLEGAAVMPYSSDRRVFIIQDADLMTVSAQNALLKTLEDGPKYAVFVLLAQNSDVFLPTITSRCVTYKTQPLADAVVQNYLVAQGIGREAAETAASHAAGSIGRGMMLAADEDFAALRITISGLADSLDDKGIPAVFEAAKLLEKHKERIGDVLDMLCLFYRNILVAECGEDDYAHGYVKAIVDNINIIDETRRKLNRNCNFLLTMEVMLLRLKR